jgi:hypothetical protein
MNDTYSFGAEDDVGPGKLGTSFRQALDDASAEAGVAPMASPLDAGVQGTSQVAAETTGTEPVGAAPDRDIHLAQAVAPAPGLMPPLPLPPEAQPQLPTAAQLQPVFDRAARRLDYVGTEVAQGAYGSAAAHLLAGKPFPPSVDDPDLAGPISKPAGSPPVSGPDGGRAADMAAAPLPAAALPAAAVSAMAQAKAEGCRLVFVEENSNGSKDTAWRKYEDQTPGAITDPVTGNRIAPALQYENAKPNGVPYVKFDGFQTMPSGLVEVIDSKYGIPLFPHNGQTFIPDDTKNQFTRQSQALEQNPGCEGIIHVRNQEEKAKAEAVIRLQGINNLPVAVRPFYQ